MMHTDPVDPAGLNPPPAVPDHSPSGIAPGSTYGPYYWPPQTGAMFTYHWTGWGPMKHIVLFAHGKYGWYATMHEMYCDAGVSPTKCSMLELPAFKHLVFVFASSGITDPGFGYASGWSIDVYDSSTYLQPLTALSGLTDELLLDGGGVAVPAFECRMVRIWVCKFFDRSTTVDKKKTEKDGKNDRSPNPYGKIKPKSMTLGFKHGWDCDIVEREKCPFNARSELMIAGYSDGGGYAFFANYYAPMITKAVGIDFWGYSDYENWVTAAGATVDAKMYTACDSWTFDHGPAGIVDKLSPPPLTYVTGSGFAATDYQYIGTNDYSLSMDPADNLEYYEWVWENSCTYQRVAMAIHGLGSGGVAPAWATAGGVLPDADHSDWQNECGSDVSGGHGPMKYKANVIGDIVGWLSPSSWGTCTTGRRLSRELFVQIDSPREQYIQNTIKFTEDTAMEKKFLFHMKEAQPREASKGEKIKLEQMKADPKFINKNYEKMNDEKKQNLVRVDLKMEFYKAQKGGK